MNLNGTQLKQGYGLPTRSSRLPIPVPGAKA